VYSRNLDDTTEKFPDIVAGMKNVIAGGMIAEIFSCLVFLLLFCFFVFVFFLFFFFCLFVVDFFIVR
jgi:hypothetical protein